MSECLPVPTMVAVQLIGRLVLPGVICVLAGVAINAYAAPAAQPLLRSGACPTGYHSSGKYCVPGPAARYAIERNGACPSGYFASAGYCVASSEQSALAIHRSGSCPGGYVASGHYCVRTRN